jgi:pimeloyl-ACP methyl ester carboxylesterase
MRNFCLLTCSIGVFLAASGAASMHSLLESSADRHWSSSALAEVELLGGFWLIAGPAPRWTRILGVSSSIGLLAYDLSQALRGQPPRPGFGRIEVGTWVNLGLDFTFVFLLLHPSTSRRSPVWLGPRPGWVLTSVVLSVAAGVMIDREHFGQYPAIGEVAPSYSGGPIGLRYLLYLPQGYHHPSRRWPLVIFLHGSGSIGHDLEKVKHEGLARWAEKRGDLSFLLVAPQAPSGGWSPTAVDALLDQVLARYRVDPDRVYLTGLSMGGYGTWATASAHPARFAAIAPICGGGDLAMVGSLRSIPTWVFHGAKDDIVPLEQSQRMVEALKGVGGDVRFTVYPDIGHDCWTATYDDPGFYTWLLTQKRCSGAP